MGKSKFVSGGSTIWVNDSARHDSLGNVGPASYTCRSYVTRGACVYIVYEEQ